MSILFRSIRLIGGFMDRRMTMPDCKYCQDEICVNADCPMCADYCPVVDVPGVCRFEEREEAKNAKQT